MLKFTFNALIQQHCPTMFHTATVRPKRSGPSILYNTPLTEVVNSKFSLKILHQSTSTSTLKKANIGSGVFFCLM